MTTACPSARFARDADEATVTGLAAIWSREPGIAPRVERAIDGDSPVVVAPSRAGEPTASVRLGDGRTLQLHSRYDPIGEAEKLIDKLPSVDGLAYFVLGFGLGHHVEALLRRVPSTARVWIIEPEADVIAAAIRSRPSVASIFESSRVGLIAEIDRPTLFPKFQPLAALLAAGITIVEHAPSVERSRPFFAAARAWIEETESFARTALNTLVLNSRATVTNIARNLHRYASSPGIGRLHGAYRGQPAIIVSAGPSLRKNRHLLKDAVGRAVIIAVQTTLKPLLEMCIEPDFVTSLDYSEISARFFHDLPKGIKTQLVAEPKATDAIFGLHTGPTRFAGNEFADELLRGAMPHRPRLKSGATVAHLSFYLAEYLGCDPILFVGQDLGFSDGLCYAPGTSYDDVWRPELGRFQTVEMKQWEQIARERSILRRVPDVDGRPMYTEQRLFSYLQQFERDFAETKARVIDASEGGALKRGATPMPLADALRRFCSASLSPTPMRIDDDAGTVARSLAALEARLVEAAEIRDIAERVVPLLQEVFDHVDDVARVNRAVAAIDPLRSQMNSLGRTFSLVMQLAQQDEFERFKADMSIDGDAAATPAQRQRRRAERDLTNARAIAGATRAFESLVQDAIARFPREAA